MRQTGRTSRIANFVVEQLFNVGTCIATDHVVYEHTASSKHVRHLEEMVKRDIEIKTKGRNSVKTTVLKIEGVPYVKFELKLVNIEDV